MVSSGTRPPASLRQSPPLRWFDDARIARKFRVPSLSLHVSSRPTIRGMFNGGLRDCAEDFSPNSVVAFFCNICTLLQLMHASPFHDGNLYPLLTDYLSERCSYGRKSKNYKKAPKRTAGNYLNEIGRTETEALAGIGSLANLFRLHSQSQSSCLFHPSLLDGVGV